MADLDGIKKTLINISKGNDILDTLIEFERTLSNVELFSYKNWIFGELVEGPIISRYWYKTVWMYPRSMMPDPDGGLRLTALGARVFFEKSIFKKPIKVTGPEDWADPESKRAKMVDHNVWLVTIELPMKYINRSIDQEDEVISQSIKKSNSDIADIYKKEAEEIGQPEELGVEMMPPETGEPPEENI